MKWKRFIQTSIVAIAAVFLLTSTIGIAEAAYRATYRAPTVRAPARAPTVNKAPTVNRSVTNNTRSITSRPATKAYKPTSKAGKAQKSIGSTSKKDWDAKRASYAAGKTNKTVTGKNKYPDAKRKKYLKKYGNTHGGHVYNDPFNHMYIFMFSGLWWHHHSDEVDTSHYDDDDMEDIREDMARYEGQPKNPNYMDEGMDESVMYSDGYLARVKTGTFGLDDNPIVESSGIGGCFIATTAHAKSKSKSKSKKKKKKKKLSFGDDDDDDFEGGGCFIATAQAAQKKKKKAVKKPVVKRKAPIASTTAKPGKVYDKKGNQIDPKTGKVIKKKKKGLFEVEDDGDINVLGMEVYDPDDDEEDDDERYERRQHNEDRGSSATILVALILFMAFIIIMWMLIVRRKKV